MPQNNNHKIERIKRILMFILMVLLVLAVGFFAINQILKFFYNSAFLQTPCELCASLNEQQAECIKGCFQERVPTSQDFVLNTSILNDLKVIR